MRNAAGDLAAIARELHSLQLVTQTLEKDTAKPTRMLAVNFHRQISEIPTNCDRVVSDIHTTLEKHAKSQLCKQGYWTFGGGKTDLNKYKSSLEAHKSTL